MNENKNCLVIDTGILIEFLEDSVLGKKFEQNILDPKKKFKLKIPFIVETELKYLLCRRFGYKSAIEKVEKALSSFQVHSEEELRNIAVRYKCKYTVSLADCYAMALAELEQVPLYMKKEKEIEPVVKDPKLPIRILFLDDI